MPKVLNRRYHGVPPGAVYVGRPTKWGNPYRIGPDGTREEVIAKYERYAARFTPEELAALRGKDLVCWCAPAPCHADVLLRLANERR